jgi:hypothetical protein
LTGLPLASYKLRFHDDHARAVPAKDETGCAFAGPGVDLRGEEARAVFALATPFRDWLDARERGVTLRSLSVDLAAQRVLITLEPDARATDPRPRVVRIDPPHAGELIAATAALEAALGAACIEKLRRRVGRPAGGPGDAQGG